MANACDECSMTLANTWFCRWLSRIAACARHFSVTSWKTSTTPEMVPAASRIGAPLSSMGTSRPSRASKAV